MTPEFESGTVLVLAVLGVLYTAATVVAAAAPPAWKFTLICARLAGDLRRLLKLPENPAQAAAKEARIQALADAAYDRGRAESNRAPPVGPAVLLLLALATVPTACAGGIFGSPEVKSPCAGLWCLSVEIASVVEPMVCYQTELEFRRAQDRARAKGARACSRDGARTVCR